MRTHREQALMLSINLGLKVSKHETKRRNSLMSTEMRSQGGQQTCLAGGDVDILWPVVEH